MKRTASPGEARLGLHPWKGVALALAALGASAGIVSTSLASCAQTPTSVPVQTMAQPQKVDFVCLHVRAGVSGPEIVPPVPVPQEYCAPVAAGVDGTQLPYHLHALVTQLTRGEVAVVDLTGGYVVDVDTNTPGYNFLPVGRLPTDIAVAPDGQMAYVGSGDPAAPAIYALPTSTALGDSQHFTQIDPDAGSLIVPNLTTWPACSLPQAPGAIVLLPTSPTAAPPPGTGASDAGAAEDAGGAPQADDAGTDAGAQASPQVGYVIVAVLPGDSVNSAKVVTINPDPLYRGAGNFVSPGVVSPDPTGQATVKPGSLTPCPIFEYIPLAAPTLATAPVPGPAWSDGLPYRDASIDVDLPASATAVCAPGIDAGSSATALLPPIAPRAGASVLDTSGPRPTLYVADAELPVIHVIDLSDPTRPQEVAPLQATSLSDPKRVVSVGQIAVSPTTSQYQRFLYAIDRADGSLMVYDVTDPVAGPRVPLIRPHLELNPFQPPDRVTFNAPAASLSFVRNDWPLAARYKTPQDPAATSYYTALTGLICNPNPNVNANTTKGNLVTPELGPFVDEGASYRANTNTSFLQVGLVPQRLRGIFAFVALSNGNVVIIDVDDWDAPCRRPDPLVPHGFATPIDGNDPQLGVDGGAADSLVAGPFSAIAPPEPRLDYGNHATDFDPYHAPFAFQKYNVASPVSLEWFFPAVAPHRARSFYLLRNDPTNGNHAPLLVGAPQLYSRGSPVTTTGAQAVANPSLVPTDTNFVDPSLQADPTQPDPSLRTSALAGADGGSQLTPGSTPGVRFAYEDPQVHTEQDWFVTYEGPIPGFIDGAGNPLVLANVVAGGGADAGAAGYQTLSLVNANASFCDKGVEDFTLGQQRAVADNAALEAAGLPRIDSYDSQVADYVQLTDPLLDQTDPYWGLSNACWGAVTTNQGGTSGGNASVADGAPGAAQSRYDLCTAVFSSTLDPNNPNIFRDFPVVEAYQDHLVIGRYGYKGAAITPRYVVGSDPSNAEVMSLMQCCFHDQVHFNVRTGGEWNAIGGASGFMHHVVAGDGGRCQPSCLEKDALLNGRAPPVPRPFAPPSSAPLCVGQSVPRIDRDSVLAMRNPMFSFLVWNGQATTGSDDAGAGAAACSDAPPVRDMVWRFHAAGQYTPYAINLAAATNALSPQSMKFISSLEQLAIVDGESQGLILIDLDLVAESHAPYF